MLLGLALSVTACGPGSGGFGDDAGSPSTGSTGETDSGSATGGFGTSSSDTGSPPSPDADVILEPRLDLRSDWIVDPRIFGRFQEHNGRDAYPGMLASHLANGSFEDWYVPVGGEGGQGVCEQPGVLDGCGQLAADPDA